MIRDVLITPERFNAAEALEQELLRGDSLFFVEGTNPSLLVSAIHGVPHKRAGSLKGSDRGSLKLACLLHLVAGTSLLVQTKPDQLDSNFHKDCEAKALVRDLALSRKVRFAMDIHSAHPLRPYDLEIGAMDGVSVAGSTLPNLSELLRSHGLVVAVDRVFKGIGGGETMVAAWHKHQTEALQLEVSSWIASGDGGIAGMNALSKTANALALFLADQLLRRSRTEVAGFENENAAYEGNW